MPRIQRNVTDCAFFLYQNDKDAHAGSNAQGTGFLVSMPSAVSKNSWDSHYYAVTNRHVIDKPTNAPVIRLNTKADAFDVKRLTSDDWHFFDAGDDVAIAPIDLDFSVHSAATVDTFFFADERWITDHSIGLGDEVFMIGLFIDNEAQTHNVPMARFGHISMMARDEAPLMQPNGTRNSSFVLDMHSRTGFSGSPVFVYRTIGADLEGANTSNVILNQPTLFRFLGILWGQFPETFRIGSDPKVRDQKIKGMSGMSCAVPAWRIKKLLDTHPELLAMRKTREIQQKADSEIHGRAEPMSRAASAGESEPPTTEENPSHREDFRRLVDAAARKRPQGDET